MQHHESVKEVSEILRKRPNWVFEIQIPGSATRFGKKRQSEALIDSNCLEAYFDKIARNNKVDQFIVVLHQPNGTSFVKKTSHILMFGPATVVAKPTTIVEEPTKIVAPPTTIVEDQNLKRGRDFRGLGSVQDFVLLTTEEQLADYKRRYSDLEHKYREIQDQNLKLTRDNVLKDDKHQLEILKIQLETAAKSKEGLSGIMGDLNSMPPEAWKFLVGLFPNHPMAKQMAALGEGSHQNNENQSTHKHPDQDGENSIVYIRELLHDKPVEKVAMIQMLVQKMLEKEAWLVALFKHAFPEGGEKGTSGTEENKEPSLDDQPPSKSEMK